MLLWLVATVVTAIACAALYYAAGAPAVNETAAETAPANRHFQLVLSGIDADTSAGLLGETEAVAAKAELAREMLRQKADAAGRTIARTAFGQPAIFAALAGIAVIALGIYGFVGSPNLAGEAPLEVADTATPDIDVDTALAKIETQLATNPNDMRGWTVIAPLYMQMARYADAEKAFRQMIALGDQSPKTQTDLAEALLMQKQGDASGEPMALLRTAAAENPTDPRSRFYIAGELTRTGDFANAVTAWKDLISLSKGGEPWLATAEQGLRFAQADGAPDAATPVQSDAIKGMVGGLADRLDVSGGTIEEWTRLVRSYLVLGDKASAQTAYDKAVAAYPKTFDRADLDAIAAGGGLNLTRSAK